jgi:hypothetical protein
MISGSSGSLASAMASAVIAASVSPEESAISASRKATAA